ncbi:MULTISPECIES: ABC transporter ATP-binding protein [Cytobacillus]|uniref:ABC transporter ATP-binding protein n=1 Tax=Cytobacillus TaxID=2675230 RepID=UPI001CD56945|nr:ABC transporter ATP-binding protein [Cytobacillus kochii]MCA1025365.1 ABC transporter ATP-binding protein [Cytobacillus kochii]MCM3323275.1 ABC transporter ATP-binding protein [Cytobacillus kochii]MCM3345670.1 ABC transporter ATP-binding protein [Cytobacillus kochii]MDM5208588.1 ABC transporter ATP-binding protein [Cytobacillus kochii]
MMIEFHKVNKKYGFNHVLKDISFTIRPGKIIGLVGPNGSGKSTILKLISGLTYPSSGEVSVLGEPANRRIASKVIYLTEADSFYPSFTVKDMLNFYESQFADFEQVKAMELLQFMNLNDSVKIRSLSKGNRGRLKLVLALARRAPILLLDEPFSGLDPMVRDTLVQGLLSFIDFEKQTVLMATHEIEEVETVLDELIMIEDGRFLGQYHVETIREEKGLSIKEWMKETYKG